MQFETNKSFFQISYAHDKSEIAYILHNDVHLQGIQTVDLRKGRIYLPIGS